MSDANSGFYVTIETPKGSTVKKVNGDLLSVGRAEDCNLRIAHAELGRRHLSLMLQNGKCCVEDHGSTNGTYINGKKLAPHIPTPVEPTDEVQLGHSGIKLSVSTELDYPKAEFTATQPPIVTSTQSQRQKVREETLPPAAIARAPKVVQEQGERTVFEAQKKAAQILQEAEIETERKVQEIYARANEAQAKAEEAYQRKLNEAFREAEVVYQDAQSEAGKILESARQKSAEMRVQAEAVIQERRKQTELDCERHLEEAQRTARELKENRLLEANDVIRAKEEELLKETRETMTKRLELFERDLQLDAQRQRTQLEDEIKKRLSEAQAVQKEQDEHIDKLKLEVRQLIDVRERERKALEEVEGDLEKKAETIAKTLSETDKANQAFEACKTKVNELRSEISKLEASQLNFQTQVNETQSRLLVTHEEEKQLVQKLQDTREQLNTQLLKLKEQHELQKAALIKEEKEQIEQIKFEAARRMQKTESDMMEELQEKKLRVSREIALSVETFLKEFPEPSGRELKTLQEQLVKQFDHQIVALSKDPISKNKQLHLATMKKTERWKVRATSILMGAALLWGTQQARVYIKPEASPMKRQVAAAAEERKLDLERRKFSPTQTNELRENYTDAVIYTESFTKTYLDDEFQKKFLHELAPYLLKTWRMDEEKAIQVVATSTSLVKELSGKRDNIHPDFVKKDIEKMHEFEEETVDRMTKALGSKVRFESFKKFEAKFYADYAAKN